MRKTPSVLKMSNKVSRRSLLTTLLLKFRSGQGLYCPECPLDSKIFASVEALGMHLQKTHSNSVIIKNPSSVLVQVVKQADQRGKVGPGVYKVLEENDEIDSNVLKPFAEPTLLAKHRNFLAKITGGNLQDASVCPECWITLSNVVNLQKHLFRRHLSSDWLKISVFQGDIGTNKIMEARKKLSRNSKLLSALSSRKKYARKNTLPSGTVLRGLYKFLPKYMDRKSGVYFCPECGVKLGVAKNLVRHLKEQHAHSKLIKSLLPQKSKNKRKPLLRKVKKSAGRVNNADGSLSKDAFETSGNVLQQSQIVGEIGNSKLEDSIQQPETDFFALSSLLEVFKNPIRVEIPSKGLYNSIPDVGRNSDSILALPLLQELCPITILCPLAICGKSFSSICTVNWHLKYEHKSFLQLNEAEMMDETLLQELRPPSKKKRKLDKCFNSDSNSSPSGMEDEKTTQNIGTNLTPPTSKKGKRKGRGSIPCPKCGNVFASDQSMKHHLKNNSCFKKRGNPRLVINPKLVNSEVEDSAKFNAAKNYNINGTGIELPPQWFEETPTTRKSREETHQTSVEKVSESINSELVKYKSSYRENVDAYANYLSRHLKVSHSRIILFRVDDVASSSSLNLQKINEKFGPDLSENFQKEDPCQQEMEAEMHIDRKEETFASPSTPNEPNIQELQKQDDEEEGKVEKTHEELEPGIKRSTEEDVPVFTESAAEHELAKVPTSANEGSVGRLSLRKKTLPYLTLPYREGAVLEEDSISKRKRTTAKSTDKILPSFKYSCPTGGKICSTFSKFKKHSSHHQKRSKEKGLRKEAITCPICEKLLAPEMNLRLHIEWHRRKGEIEDGLDEGNCEETKEVMTNEEDELLNV